MNPAIEAKLVKATPKAKASRGKIQIRNFLPPDDIDTLLRLYNRVDNKAMMISSTLGIPGGKLLDESDQYDDVKVFQAFKDEYDGEIAPIEELRLKWLELVKSDPGIEALVDRLPDGISAAKAGSPTGVFVCRRVPVLTKADDGAEPTWTMEPGAIEWTLRTPHADLRGATHEIDRAISSDTTTPATAFSNRAALSTALRKLERDETKRLRRDVQLPLDAPAPKTLCWMEVQ
jgi:hypothetical protein